VQRDFLQALKYLLYHAHAAVLGESACKAGLGVSQGGEMLKRYFKLKFRGGFDNALGRLRTIELVRGRGDSGQVRTCSIAERTKKLTDWKKDDCQIRRNVERLSVFSFRISPRWVRKHKQPSLLILGREHHRMRS
jgi:hypothetical protein